MMRSLLLLLLALPLAAQTPRRVTVMPDSATLVYRDTLRLTATVSPTGTVTWSSGDTSVASVRQGKLTAKAKPGCVLIRATANIGARTSMIACVRAPIVTPPPADTTTPPPPTPGLAFASDWSVGGITQGGAWNNTYCASITQVLTVVPGAAIGWTQTPNVLRLQQLGENGCGMLERTAAVPASKSHWGRVYFRNDETQTTHNHIAAYNPVGDIQATIFGFRGTSGGAEVFLKTLHGANYPQDIWTMKGAPHTAAARVPNGQWYRYEWHMEYVTATTYRIHPRLYDLAGTLIADERTTYWNDSNGSASQSLAAWYAAGRTFTCSPTLCRNIGLGQEGPAGSGNTGGYWYHAAFALSLTNWIGR